MAAQASVNTTKETQCLLARTLHNKVLNSSTMLFQELQPQKVFILTVSLWAQTVAMRIGTPVVLSACVAGFRLRVHGTLQIGPTVSSYPPGR